MRARKRNRIYRRRIRQENMVDKGNKKGEHTHFFPYVKDASVSPTVQHLIMQTAPTQSLASHEGAGFPTTKSAVWNTLIEPIQVRLGCEWLECRNVSCVWFLSTCLQQQHFPVCHL
jgi:hypothetical protein